MFVIVVLLDDPGIGLGPEPVCIGPFATEMQARNALPSLPDWVRDGELVKVIPSTAVPDNPPS